MFIGDPKPNENAEEPENVQIQRHKYRRNGPDRFQSISFESARFESGADFSSRTFDGVINFGNALFFQPPIFHNASNVAQIDFSGTRIKFALSGKRQWTSDSTIPIRLRALRKIAEETKNHDLERDLYVEERKAERGVYWRQFVKELKAVSITEKPRVLGRLLSHCLWIVVLFGYGGLADYGRSFLRPLAWLVLSVWLFHWGYASILAPLKQNSVNTEQYEQAVWMLAVGNAVPFVGHLSIDAGIKKSLYCPDDVCGERAPIPPLGLKCW